MQNQLIRIIFLIQLFTVLFGGKFLAVLEMEPVGLTTEESRILTQRLTSKLIDLSDYVIVERANIDKILKEQKFQHSGCTDSDCAVEIGQLLNADLTVIGTASKFGKTYTLDCRIINVESGQALASASYTHTGEIDELVKDGISSIAHKLLGIPYNKKIKQSGTQNNGYGATLVIESEPQGAEIYINDSYFDLTPITLEGFPIGEYNVELKLAGYEDYSTHVRLSPRGYESINGSLKYIPSYINISGNPAKNSVEIFIDGKKGNFSGNYAQVPPGPHIVEVKFPDYISFIDTISVAIGETKNIKYNLKKNIGYLLLKNLPDLSSTKITINGKSFLKIRKFELPPGEHQLEIRHSLFKTINKSVSIQRGLETIIDVQMEPLMGTLVVNSIPNNIELRINDKILNTVNDYKLRYGQYNLTASAPYYFPKTTSIKIDDTINSFNIELKSGRHEIEKITNRKKKYRNIAFSIGGILLINNLFSEWAYSKYTQSTNMEDAQNYRNLVESSGFANMPLAASLGISSVSYLYFSIEFNRLSKILSIQ